MAAYEFRNDKGALLKLELMLNNEERSDIVFLVNDARYHALSHLVAMNSTVLELLMNEYFAHCEDREIKIHNVKHEDSFYLVLQYMYGVKMNFTELNINVVCEALCLAEKYEMTDFSKELKQYVSTKIEGFNIEAVVTLLNTSRKFNLDDLYKKVTEYAYKNAEQLVKHASFVQLQYEVLVDLLKSDWFFAKEIEILTGVLTWNDDIDAKRSNINDGQVECEIQLVVSEENLVEKTNTLSVENDAQNNIMSVNLEAQSDTASVDNDAQTDTLSVSMSGPGSSAESVSETMDGNNTDTANLTSSGAKDLTNLMQSFKENVLKSLLLHIRHLRFSAFEYMKVLETDLFVKYKDLLADYNNFSQSTDLRKQYLSTTVPINIVNTLYHKYFNIDRTFKINRHSLNETFRSEEKLQIGNFKLNIDLNESSPYKNNNSYIQIHLSCSSDEGRDWECYTEVQVIWKPFHSLISFCNLHCGEGSQCEKSSLWKYLPIDKNPGKFSLTSSEPRVYIGQYELDLTNVGQYNQFIINNTIELNVIFKTFHIKN